MHFLQIWIRPDRMGMVPGYEQKTSRTQEKRGRLRLIVSGDGAEGSVRIHQDARMYAGLFNGSERADLEIEPGRRVYVHLVRGKLTVNGTRLSGGDALTDTDVMDIELRDGVDAEVLVFDLPGRMCRSGAIAVRQTCTRRGCVARSRERSYRPGLNYQSSLRDGRLLANEASDAPAPQGSSRSLLP